MKNNNQIKKERMSLIINQSGSDFIKLICKKSGISKLELCNLMFYNGIDLFILGINDLSLKFINGNISQLKKDLNSWRTKERLNYLLTYNKIEVEDEENI